MKKFLALLLLVPTFAFAAWAHPDTAQKGNGSVFEVQGTASPATRTAPSLGVDGATAGLSLAQPQSAGKDSLPLNFSITVCSATGTTLSGAGTLEFYFYDPFLPEWSHWKTASVSVTATTRCQTFAPPVGTPNRGQLMVVASGVTFSGGSAGVTVTLIVR